MTIRQNNELAYHIGLVDVKTKTELLGPIWLGAIYDEN